jgi:hypothetical protein
MYTTCLFTIDFRQKTVKFITVADYKRKAVNNEGECEGSDKAEDVPYQLRFKQECDKSWYEYIKSHLPTSIPVFLSRFTFSKGLK